MNRKPSISTSETTPLFPDINSGDTSIRRVGDYYSDGAYVEIPSPSKKNPRRKKKERLHQMKEAANRRRTKRVVGIESLSDIELANAPSFQRQALAVCIAQQLSFPVKLMCFKKLAEFDRH